MPATIGDNRTEMMVGDEANNNGGGDGSESSLKVKVAELQRQLRVEKYRFCLLESQAEVEKLVAQQEVEKYRRDCSSLEDRVARSEQDCNILRERVLRDQENVRGLLEEIETMEKEFKEKFIELKVENRDLQCGRRHAQDEADEWRRKYVELEAEKSRIAKGVEGSSARPVDEVDDELPERAEECFVLTPEKKSSGAFVGVDCESEGEGGCDDDDKEDDDEVPIWQFMKKRRVEAADGTKKAYGSKSSRSRGHGRVSRRRAVSLLPREVGNAGGEATAAEAQIPPMPENSTQEVAAKGLQANHKRNFKNQMNRSTYIGRIPSSEQILSAKKRAETLQSNLRSSNPSFIKLMAGSNVSGGFWLRIPSKFCMENLPAHELKMILEDERGLEYAVNCIGHNAGFSAGWRAFALAHNLEMCDALIFELCKPARFKVYIVKAIPEELREGFDGRIVGEHTDGTNKQANN